ncbi:MAG: hypothetical protein BYD32DRAFT_84825 [Podila humilis]|nr:MAG: hypothetical protein BYD32DRAFT_84825 [Podila humilis]
MMCSILSHSHLFVISQSRLLISLFLLWAGQGTKRACKGARGQYERGRNTRAIEAIYKAVEQRKEGVGPMRASRTANLHVSECVCRGGEGGKSGVVKKKRRKGQNVSFYVCVVCKVAVSVVSAGEGGVC